MLVLLAMAFHHLTLYKPRIPSCLYIFMRASSIPLYCRLDESIPASYCNTSRVFVTHIGFVIHRVMAPNRWKIWQLYQEKHWTAAFQQQSSFHTQCKRLLLLLFLKKVFLATDTICNAKQNPEVSDPSGDMQYHPEPFVNPFPFSLSPRSTEYLSCLD